MPELGGVASEIFLKMAKDAGAITTFSKPIVMEELIDKVKKMLGP